MIISPLSLPLTDKLLPYVSLGSEEQRREYYVDGLHLTVKGYDRMAELVMEVIGPELRLEVLAAEARVQPLPASADAAAVVGGEGGGGAITE